MRMSGSGQGSPPSAPSAPSSSFVTPYQPVPPGSSLIENGHGSLGLLNSHFLPSGNPGAYASSPPASSSIGAGMQVGIASMMASQGASGFSEMSSMMMQNDSQTSSMGSSDEDLFSVSL